MQWNRVRRVAAAEFSNIVRTKAFLVSIILMPVLMGGSAIIPALIQEHRTVEDRSFGVVDPTGELFAVLDQAAKARESTLASTAEDESKKASFHPVLIEAAGDSDRAALSERVRKGELFAWVEIPEDIFEKGSKAAPRYHSDSATYRELSRWIQGAVTDAVMTRRLNEADMNPTEVKQLISVPTVESYGLVKAGDATGEAEKVNPILSFGVPFVCLMLIFTLTLTAAPLLLNSVLEEKMQRIAEILVSSVRPFELFLGKLMGAGTVALLLGVLYVGGMCVVAARFDILDQVSPTIFVWFGFFLVLALLIHGSIFIAIGAACSEVRDTQSLMMPAMMLLLLPMFLFMPVLEDPTSGFARAVSFIPPATPFLMMLRVAVSPSMPWWEVAAAAATSLLFALFCIWAAGRIFRIGILSQGKAPSFTELCRWIARG